MRSILSFRHICFVNQSQLRNCLSKVLFYQSRYYFVNFTRNVVHYQCLAICPSGTFLNSTNFCVNAINCPASEYGDPHNQTCVTDCPNNSTLKTYANTNPNVKLCVMVCPANFYKQDLTDNHTCVPQCLPNYFIDYVSAVCVGTCPNGSFAYLNGSCLSSCPAGWFADDALHICNTTCAGGTFRDPTSRYCVNTCPPGYFADITSGYICVTICSNVTEYGDPVRRECVVRTSCTPPFIFADDHSRQCVTLCPESQNTFGDQTANYCNLTCPWGPTLYQYKDHSSQRCVSKCPINPSLYADNTTFSCVFSCTGDNYAVDATRTCEPSCPNHFFRNNITRRCESTCGQDPV